MWYTVWDVFGVADSRSADPYPLANTSRPPRVTATTPPGAPGAPYSAMIWSTRSAGVRPTGSMRRSVMV